MWDGLSTIRLDSVFEMSALKLWQMDWTIRSWYQSIHSLQISSSTVFWENSALPFAIREHISQNILNRFKRFNVILCLITFVHGTRTFVLDLMCSNKIMTGEGPELEFFNVVSILDWIIFCLFEIERKLHRENFEACRSGCLCVRFPRDFVCKNK